MNSSNNKVTLLIITILLLSGCTTSEIQKAEILPTQPHVLPKKDLSQIDLSKLERIAPKGRVQDKEYNQLPIIDDLIANGKDSIPFLIGKLDDETKINRHVLDYWYEVSIGDLALAILTDFFTDASWKNTTISGLGWDKFLERGDDKDSTGEAILRKYIKKHGRKKIKERWQKIWEQNKENIYWDESDRCFNVKQSENK
jgi:hypothetical protein